MNERRDDDTRLCKNLGGQPWLGHSARAAITGAVDLISSHVYQVRGPWAGTVQALQLKCPFYIGVS